MRVITAFFSVENLQLNPGQLPPMKEAIHGCREWLGTNEGVNRIAIFEKLTCSRQAPPKPAAKVFHFSVLIEGHKQAKPTCLAATPMNFPLVSMGCIYRSFRGCSGTWLVAEDVWTFKVEDAERGQVFLNPRVSGLLVH